MPYLACPACGQTLPDNAQRCLCGQQLAPRPDVLVAHPARVDDTFAWAIVATPLVTLLLVVVLGNASAAFLVLAVVNAVLGVQDEKRVRAAGYRGVSWFWAFLLVPVYLVLRARQTGRWAIPLMWGLCFLVYVAAMSAAAG